MPLRAALIVSIAPDVHELLPEAIAPPVEFDDRPQRTQTLERTVIAENTMPPIPDKLAKWRGEGQTVELLGKTLECVGWGRCVHGVSRTPGRGRSS